MLFFCGLVTSAQLGYSMPCRSDRTQGLSSRKESARVRPVLLGVAPVRNFVKRREGKRNWWWMMKRNICVCACPFRPSPRAKLAPTELQLVCLPLVLHQDVLCCCHLHSDRSATNLANFRKLDAYNNILVHTKQRINAEQCAYHLVSVYVCLACF